MFSTLFNKTLLYSSRFGYCGQDEGYCYPRDGCLMRGIRLLGGDLPAPEGGGGVLVDIGELDGCAYLLEQNSRGQYFSYDPESNLCYLKAERGRLVNDTESSRYTSGSQLIGGCN